MQFGSLLFLLSLVISSVYCDAPKELNTPNLGTHQKFLYMLQDPLDPKFRLNWTTKKTALKRDVNRALGPQDQVVLYVLPNGNPRIKRYIPRMEETTPLPRKVLIPKSCRKRFDGKKYVDYADIPDPYSYMKEERYRAINEFPVPLYIPSRWYFYQRMKKGIQFPLTGPSVDISDYDYFISEYGF